MGGVLQRNSTGQIVRCTTGGDLIRGPCGGEMLFCCHCGDCCYSKSTTASLTWSFDQPPDYAGWPNWLKTSFDAMAAGSYAVIPVPESVQPRYWCDGQDLYGQQGSLNWDSWANPANNGVPAQITRNCTTNAWGLLIGDMYANIRVDPLEGTCCRLGPAAGTVTGAFCWWDEMIFDYYCVAVTGTVSGALANNACCHDIDPHQCREGATCDGTGRRACPCAEEGI